VNLRHDELLQRQQASIWSLETALREARSQYDQLRGQCEAISGQQHQQQQQNDVWRHELATRCEEHTRRSDGLEAALHAHAVAQCSQLQAVDARLLEGANGLNYLHELLREQHAVHLAAGLRAHNQIETLSQQAQRLAQHVEILAQQNELLEQQNALLQQRSDWLQQRTEQLQQRAEQLQQRTDVLQQRLFWPMVVRKSRSALARVKRSAAALFSRSELSSSQRAET
jgi:hypothetical protein